MSIIGAIADIFRSKPKSSSPSSGGGRVYNLSDLSKIAGNAADQTSQSVQNLTALSAAHNDRFLSQKSPPAAVPYLSTVAKKVAAQIASPYKQSIADIVAQAIAFENGYVNMLRGFGWASQNLQIDNIQALLEIGQALQAQAMLISAAAAALNQEISQSQRSTSALRAPMPRSGTIPRKVAIQGVIDELGPSKAFEVLGEDIWDAWE